MLFTEACWLLSSSLKVRKKRLLGVLHLVVHYCTVSKEVWKLVSYIVILLHVINGYYNYCVALPAYHLLSACGEDEHTHSELSAVTASWVTSFRSELSSDVIASTAAAVCLLSPLSAPPPPLAPPPALYIPYWARIAAAVCRCAASTEQHTHTHTHSCSQRVCERERKLSADWLRVTSSVAGFLLSLHVAAASLWPYTRSLQLHDIIGAGGRTGVEGVRTHCSTRCIMGTRVSRVAGMLWRLRVLLIYTALVWNI